MYLILKKLDAIEQKLGERGSGDDMRYRSSSSSSNKRKADDGELEISEELLLTPITNASLKIALHILVRYACPKAEVELFKSADGPPECGFQITDNNINRRTDWNNHPIQMFLSDFIRTNDLLTEETHFSSIHSLPNTIYLKIKPKADSWGYIQRDYPILASRVESQISNIYAELEGNFKHILPISKARLPTL